jgi:hypothetical protein
MKGIFDGVRSVLHEECRTALGDARFYLVGRDLNRRTMDKTNITAKIADTSPVIVIPNRIVLRRSTGKRYPPFRRSGYPRN